MQTIFLTHNMFDTFAFGWGDLKRLENVRWAWLDTPIMSGIAGLLCHQKSAPTLIIGAQRKLHCATFFMRTEFSSCRTQSSWGAWLLQWVLKYFWWGFCLKHGNSSCPLLRQCPLLQPEFNYPWFITWRSSELKHLSPQLWAAYQLVSTFDIRMIIPKDLAFGKCALRYHCRSMYELLCMLSYFMKYLVC